MMSTLPLLLAQLGHEVRSHAASGNDGFNWVLLFNPAVVWVLIPIVAIVVSAVAKIMHRSQEHRERMAMIAAGLHPDYPPDEDPDTGTEMDLRETTAHLS